MGRLHAETLVLIAGRYATIAHARPILGPLMLPISFVFRSNDGPESPADASARQPSVDFESTSRSISHFAARYLFTLALRPRRRPALKNALPTAYRWRCDGSLMTDAMLQRHDAPAAPELARRCRRALTPVCAPPHRDDGKRLFPMAPFKRLSLTGAVSLAASTPSNAQRHPPDKRIRQAD